MMFSINYNYHHDEIQGMKFVMLFVNVKVALTNINSINYGIIYRFV